MPTRLCPDVVFLRPRFDAYRAVSAEIHSIFNEFTDLVEAVSLDEAYLDVTDSPFQQGSSTLMTKKIKRRIVNQHN